MNATELQRLRYLASLYAVDACTRPELEELLSYIQQAGSEEVLRELLQNDWNALQPLEPNLPVNWDAMFDRVLSQEESSIIPMGQRRTRKLFIRWMAAAAVLAAAMTGVWFFTRTDNRQQSQQALGVVTDIKAGTTGAVLTLADGTQVVLDSAANGQIATQSNATIVKQDGQLVYQQNSTAAPEPAMNLLTTPRGRQYQLQLPDGTKVWLNAGSSIRYPAFFTGKTREVSVTGEVYFEVAQQPVHPFIVAAPRQTVEVLGTSFNINTYENEPVVRTTLLDGAINVKLNAATTTILHPGQQAVIRSAAADNITVKEVDASQAIAWKNGQFHFDHATIPDVMRQLERWYDIEVIYEGSVPHNVFGGKLERSMPLSGVLKLLEESGVMCKTAGRQVTVLSP